jgi:hypothetical protein
MFQGRIKPTSAQRNNSTSGLSPGVTTPTSMGSAKLIMVESAPLDLVGKPHVPQHQQQPVDGCFRGVLRSASELTAVSAASGISSSGSASAGGVSNQQNSNSLTNVFPSRSLPGGSTNMAARKLMLTMAIRQQHSTQQQQQQQQTASPQASSQPVVTSANTSASPATSPPVNNQQQLSNTTLARLAQDQPSSRGGGGGGNSNDDRPRNSAASLPFMDGSSGGGPDSSNRVETTERPESSANSSEGGTPLVSQNHQQQSVHFPKAQPPPSTGSPRSAAYAQRHLDNALFVESPAPSTSPPPNALPVQQPDFPHAEESSSSISLQQSHPGAALSPREPTPPNEPSKPPPPPPPPSNPKHPSRKVGSNPSGGLGAAPPGGKAAAPAVPNPKVHIDIGPACQSLSLYEAFTFDTSLKMWVVQDEILAKCLEYVRIMGYTHPDYHKTVVNKKSTAPSIWCTSATIPTPITAVPSATRATPSELRTPTSPTKIEKAASTPPTTSGSGGSDDKNPPVAGPQWKLNPSLLVSKAPAQDDSKPHPITPFFECEEALRWLAEQEYVIGTILLCCSYEPMQDKKKKKKDDSSDAGHTSSPPRPRRQYVPPHTHPIKYVAAHVIHNFSHWGDFKSFASFWDAQVRIVLGVAQPSHQRVLPIPETGLIFSSDFECGNLARVQRHVQSQYNMSQNTTQSTTVYLLWIEGDTQSDKRLWFRFAVSGCKERDPLCLRLMNIAPNSRLYRNGMRPVWRAGASQLQWTPVEDYTFHLINDERDGELSFYVVPKSSFETIHVAFCVPYSYGDLLCHITQWHALVKRSACNIRFEERVLCRSLDERKLHLLIITSQTEKIGKQSQQPDSRGRSGASTPYSSFQSGKKVVLISGRVHPGEVTASHAVHGIISFLLSHDPRAAQLREHFIFFVVPMLNPDGVARGFSRLDQNGFNLNRCYNDPVPATQPTVHSLKNVFEHLQANFRDRFFMYLDFHSHASQQSGFAFGNHLPNNVQHWNMLYPKLIETLRSNLFDFNTCRFSKGHMVSKEGTSRVLFGGSLIHSYTIELTHFTDMTTFGDNGLKDPNAGLPSARPSDSTKAETKAKDEKQQSSTAALTEGGITNNAAPKQQAGAAGGLVLQSPVIAGVLSQSAEVGRACVLALLDYCGIGEMSAELQKFGGLDKAIREVKREIRGGGPQRPSSYNSQSSFKQY